MAVETKIGLVVGLGFIVCFGVILQHRGSGDRLSTDVAIELLKRHREPVAARQSPRFNKFTRSNPADRRTISALPSRNVPVERPGDAMASGRAPAGRRATQTAKLRTTRPNAAQGKPRPTHQAKTQAVKASPLSTRPAYEALFGEDVRARETPPVEEVAKPQTPPRTSRPAQRVSPRRLKPVAKERRTYVVKPGDSLWGIAERAYGRRSRALVDALYAANRGQMSSPGALKVGMRLTVPEAEGAKSVGPAHRELTARATPPAGPVRFYQVQKGDRYMTIAARFLGDKTRWKELYELNKDIFPDAGKIRPGVRIRLPATVLADAR